MAEKTYQAALDGQELQLTDLGSTVAGLGLGAGLGAVAGLADDHVLAEFLRLTPFVTAATKAIFPFGYLGSSAATPTVATSGSANGSIVVSPFRAIVGSRNAVGGSPSPNPSGDNNSLANWRDIRSGIWIGSSSSLTSTIAIAANSSGNPRWDLVYATITPDANAANVVRRVKDPNSGVLTTPSVPAFLNQPGSGGIVTVTVLAGTPGASPAFPTIPADAAGNYNIALALVRVVNGFSSSSTLNSTDVTDVAPVAPMSRTLAGAASCLPANQSSSSTGTFTTNFPFSATVNTRPGPFVPAAMSGMESVFVPMDVVTAGAYSHPNGTVIDNSRDWRNRAFLAIASLTGAGVPDPFAWDKSSATVTKTPSVGAVSLLTFGQSFVADPGITGFPAGSMGVFNVQNSYFSLPYSAAATSGQIAVSSQVGIYIDSSGVMRSFVSATAPNARLLVWIFATGPFASY